MAERTYATGIIPPDAAREQEGQFATIEPQDVPVELMTRTAADGRFRVEEQVGHPVGRTETLSAVKIAGTGYRNGLYDGQP